MIILHDEMLENYTTFRMGGMCKNLYFPESTDELVHLIEDISGPKYYLGGGSNLIVNDKKIFRDIVCLRNFNNKFEDLGGGRYNIGASVRLQELITKVNNSGYGGIEYLFSVPGLVGGAVVMNAGRGGGKSTISDYVESITALHNGQVITLNKEDCMFSYRSSMFLNSDDIVLEVLFQFEPGAVIEFEERRKERIEFCRQKQDTSLPNFGSVFSIADGRIMTLFSRLPHRNSGVYFSRKTVNWMINSNGTFQSSMKLLKLVRLIHKILRKKCKQEVVVWD